LRQPLQVVVPPGVHPAGGDEYGRPTYELAVAEQRPVVTGDTVARPMTAAARAAQGAGRRRRRGLAVASGRGIVERSPALSGFLEAPAPWQCSPAQILAARSWPERGRRRGGSGRRDRRRARRARRRPPRWRRTRAGRAAAAGWPSTGCRRRAPAEPAPLAQVGERRRVAFQFLHPRARGRPSVQPRSGWWQVTQAMRFDGDRRASRTAARRARSPRHRPIRGCSGPARCAAARAERDDLLRSCTLKSSRAASAQGAATSSATSSRRGAACASLVRLAAVAPQGRAGGQSTVSTARSVSPPTVNDSCQRPACAAAARRHGSGRRRATRRSAVVHAVAVLRHRRLDARASIRSPLRAQAANSS